MDEIWSRKMMRRLALLAVINSVAIPLAAGEPNGTKSASAGKPTTLAELLRQDAAHKRAPGAPQLLPVPEALPEAELSSRDGDQLAVTPMVPKQAPAGVRPEQAKIDQPVKATDEQTRSAADQPKTTLGSLLSKGWDSGKRYSVSMSPREMKKQVLLTKEATPALESELPKAAVVRPKQAPLPVMPTPEHKQLKRLDAESKPTKLAELLQEAPDFSAKPSKTSVNAKTVSVSRPSQTKLTTEPELIEQTLGSPVLAERQSELLRDTVKKDGFELLATDEITAPDGLGLPDQFELPPAEETLVPPPLPKPEPPSTEMIHASRLQQVAQRLLREAFYSLGRNAGYTARKKARAGLRTAVAMRDAIEGGNQHARELELAMDAIRESREFGLGIAAVDHEQLKRLVAVHKTDVLKGKPLEDVSSLGAMVAYLEFAEAKLVAASGQRHEASYALQLLGKIERRIHDSMDTHAAAIALTYQRSAVAVDPSNAMAHFELGRTYAGQGLPQQAHAALSRSVQLSPNRDAYEQLMQAARNLGDIDTVRRCKHVLADSSLPSNFPVYELEPEVFAAIHRPQFDNTHVAKAKTTGPKQTKTQHAEPNSQKAQPKANRLSKSQHSRPQTASSDVTAMSRLRSWFTSDQ